MKSLVTLFAVFALVFAVGCGGDDDKSDGCGADKGAPPTKVDTPDKSDVPAKPDTSAAKDITYKCGCGKEKTLAADVAPPS